MPERTNGTERELEQKGTPGGPAQASPDAHATTRSQDGPRGAEVDPNCGSHFQPEGMAPVVKTIKAKNLESMVHQIEVDGEWHNVQDVEPWEDRDVLIHYGALGKMRYGKDEDIQVRQRDIAPAEKPPVQNRFDRAIANSPRVEPDGQLVYSQFIRTGGGGLINRNALEPDDPEQTYNHVKSAGIRPEDYGIRDPRIARLAEFDGVGRDDLIREILDLRSQVKAYEDAGF